MKTLKKVPVTPEYVETMPGDKEMQDGIVYISEKYGVAIHMCLCGCREKTVMPIDNVINGKDHGWKLIKEKNGSVTFTPSVGNYQLPCKSHYIITKGIANFV